MGLPQPNSSPRYPAFPAELNSEAMERATKAQAPAPASQPQTRRSESAASSGAKAAQTDRMQAAARKSAIQAYFAGLMRGASSGFAHVAFPANSVLAKRTRHSPTPPVMRMPRRTASCRCLRTESTLPTIGAAATSAKPSHSKTSFGQFVASESGLNLLITSALISADARALLPIWRMCAVRPTGMRISVKSRKRRTSFSRMMIASGTAAMSSTW